MRIKEGNTVLEVPEIEEEGFPPSSGEVFFNPEMEENRDLAIAVVASVKPKNYFDAHTATGVRAIRVANEVGELNVFANDVSKRAINYVEKNIELNQLKDVSVSNKDSNVVLFNNGFDFIDLDPFGSPVPFLENSIKSLLDNGFLAVTATDTAPLCGSHIKAGMRKYGARSLRTVYHKEIGARILAGKVIRDGLQQDKALLPLITYYRSHYFRIYFRAEEGAKKANELMDQIGFIQHCFNCGRRFIKKGFIPEMEKKCPCGNNLKNCGPLFLGEIQRRDFINNVLKECRNRELGEKKEIVKLLKTLREESEFSPTFYNVHKIAERFSTSAPKTEKLLTELRKRGHLATKTHFDPLGFKTNSDIEEVKNAFNSII